MGTKFKFTIYKVLNHLEHTILHFFCIIGTLYIPADITQAVFSHFFFRPKEYFPLICRFYYISVDIDTYKYSHFVNAVQKRTQREIS